MNRLLGRVGVRVTSVALLLAGVAGGAYLGQGEDVKQQSIESRLVVQADAAEVDLLKERRAAHAAARAPQRKAEAVAAEKAATEAKAAASRARTMEKAAIAKKKAAEKKAAEKKAAEEAEAKAAKEAEEAEKAEGRSDADDDGDAPKSTSFAGPIPTSCGSYKKKEKKIGCALVVKAGMSLKQMGCLEKLWDRESGWNANAHNNSSNAHGIPQAKPGNKMSSVGDDWEDNPVTQIKWGLGYIKSRYGTPCEAWASSESRGWY